MKGLVAFISIITVLLEFEFTLTEASCTFPTTFQNSEWHDNTKGTLTFTDTTMSGWTFTVLNSNSFDTWECFMYTDNNYLILRSDTSFTVVSSGPFRGYLCFALSQISEYSYAYYQYADQQRNLRGERLLVEQEGIEPSAEQICNTTIEVPEGEYHLLVKSGYEFEARVDCPQLFRGKYNYIYYGSDGSTHCNNTKDVWDSCSDTSITTTDFQQPDTCNTSILFSESALSWCVYSVGSYVALYNNATETNTDGSTSKFVCVVINGEQTAASVAPGNCTFDQSPDEFPKDSGGQDIGAKLVLEPFELCPPEDKDDKIVGAIVAGVLGGLCLLVLVIIAAVCIYKKKFAVHPAKEGEKPDVIPFAFRSVRDEGVDIGPRKPIYSHEATLANKSGAGMVNSLWQTLKDLFLCKFCKSSEKENENAKPDSISDEDELGKAVRFTETEVESHSGAQETGKSWWSKVKSVVFCNSCDCFTKKANGFGTHYPLTGDAETGDVQHSDAILAYLERTPTIVSLAPQREITTASIELETVENGIKSPVRENTFSKRQPSFLSKKDKKKLDSSAYNLSQPRAPRLPPVTMFVTQSKVAKKKKKKKRLEVSKKKTKRRKIWK